MLRAAFLAVAVVLLAIACHAAPRCELPARLAAAHVQPFLWRVHRAEGPVVWLYGTIHDAGADEVPAIAWTKLEAAKHFASELGNDDPDPARVAELARLRFGEPGLDHKLSADDWFDLSNAMRGAIKEDDLKRARPWFAMTRLTTHLGKSPQPSMDVALAERASKRGVPVDHLESWEEQLVALDAAVTVADLAEAIHARGTIECSLARLRAAYDAGDLPTLDRLLEVPATRMLLVERNKKWLPQIESYAAADGAFIAVGLGHLLGDSGLPAMLERAGYTVEREP